jgi:hypothetical protein
MNPYLFVVHRKRGNEHRNTRKRNRQLDGGNAQDRQGVAIMINVACEHFRVGQKRKGGTDITACSSFSRESRILKENKSTIASASERRDTNKEKTKWQRSCHLNYYMSSSQPVRPRLAARAALDAVEAAFTALLAEEAAAQCGETKKKIHQ